MTGADVNAPSTVFATGPASEKRGAKINNSPAKVWEAENEWGWASASRQDGTLRIIHEWTWLRELDSFCSGKRTRIKLQRRRAVCMYLSFFLEASGPQRLPERHRKRWLRRLVLKTTARRDATSGFAPVGSYRATLSSPCSTYNVAWVCCRDSFALLRFHRYLPQLMDNLGICSALAFASREWLIESP